MSDQGETKLGVVLAAVVLAEADDIRRVPHLEDALYNLSVSIGLPAAGLASREQCDSAREPEAGRGGELHRQVTDVEGRACGLTDRA